MKQAIRVVVMTDVHGAHGRMAAVLRREENIGLFVIGGDLTTHGGDAEAGAALDAVRGLCPRILAVAGNMDPRPVEHALVTHGVDLNARGVMVGDIGFFGLSGAPVSPLQTPNEVPEEELARRLAAGWSAVRGARCRVLVSHAPPYGTDVDRLPDGRHVGSTAVRTFCDEHAPDVVLCGHIHEARGIDRIGRTLVVNPGPGFTGYYALLTIGETITPSLERL